MLAPVFTHTDTNRQTYIHTHKPNQTGGGWNPGRVKQQGGPGLLE